MSNGLNIHILNSGLSLDLYDNTRLALSKKTDGAKAGQNSNEAATQITIPTNLHNCEALNIELSPNYSNQITEKNIKVKKDNCLLYYEILNVCGVTNKDITIQLVNIIKAWQNELKNCTLDELFKGVFFTFDLLTLQASHSGDGYIYNDGDDPFFIPVANYGANGDDCLRPQDWRPFVSRKFIIDQISKKIGRKIDIPMLATDCGRAHWDYLLRKDWQEIVNAENNQFEVKNNRVIDFSEFPLVPNGGEPFFLQDEIIDLDNAYFPSTGQYINDIETGFCLDITFTVTNVLSATNAIIYFSIVRNDAGIGTAAFTGGAGFLNVSSPGTYTISINTGCEEITQAVTTINLAGYQLALEGFIDVGGMCWSGKPKNGTVQYGDEIELCKIINNELTAWDWLQAQIQQFNLKPKHDNGNKCTTYYPCKVNGLWNGEQIESYYKQNKSKAQNITNQIVKNSEQFAKPQNDLKRFVNVGFKEDDNDTATSNDLYLKRIDYGGKYDNENETDCRSEFYGATRMDLDKNISNDNVGVYIPHIWEGEIDANPIEGNMLPDPAQCVCPRTIIAYPPGLVSQDGGATNTEVLACTDLIVVPATIIQQWSPAAPIYPNGYMVTTANGDIINLDKQNVYSSQNINSNAGDLFNLFWRDSLNDLYSAKLLKFLFKMNLEQFNSFCFRDLFWVYYHSEKWGKIQGYVNIKCIDEFTVCQDLGANVTLQFENLNK